MEQPQATFQFDDRKVATLSLEEFMKSGRLVDPNITDLQEIWYKPHEFFEKIQNLLVNLEMKYSFGPVYVSKKGSDYLADPLDKTSPRTELKRWAFNTLVTRIELKDPEGPETEFTPAVGIGFTELGVQVCIGTNVSVCGNMSIFGDYFVQSYGQNKLTMDQMFGEIVAWLLEVEKIHKQNLQILEKLRGIPITSRGGIQKLIGQLSLSRELLMAGYPSHAPLDKDEIGEMQKRLIHQYGNLLEIDRPMDLYELYNVCTNILTHSEKNLHNKWEDIFEMGEFIIEHYDVFEEETTDNSRTMEWSGEDVQPKPQEAPKEDSNEVDQM